MWFSVRPTDAGLLDRAQRQRFMYDIRLNAAPNLVFEAVTEPAHLAHWFPRHQQSRWLNEPADKGSERLVVLDGLAIKERVLVWEPGRQFLTTMTATSLPLVRDMVQQFLITTAADGSCRLRWTVAYRARLAVVPFVRWVQPRFAMIFQQGSADLEAYVRDLQRQHSNPTAEVPR